MYMHALNKENDITTLFLEIVSLQNITESSFLKHRFNNYKYINKNNTFKNDI